MLPNETRSKSGFVAPAKAGTQISNELLDARFHGNDLFWDSLKKSSFKLNFLPFLLTFERGALQLWYRRQCFSGNHQVACIPYRSRIA